MNEIILNEDNGQVVVSSRQIAEDFDKNHKDVLESIRNLVAENSAAKFFIESSYGNRGKIYPEYLMTRDGFSLLVMGFTGSEALQWKLKYIEAFNKMEESLRNRDAFARIRENMRLNAKDTTDIVKELVQPAKGEWKPYAQHHDLIYTCALGFPAWKMRQQRGLRKSCNLLDHLTVMELECVQEIRYQFSELYEWGFNIKEIEDKLSSRYKKSLKFQRYTEVKGGLLL